MSSVYERMLEAALGHLEAYQTDLTKHDRLALEGVQGQFLWICRSAGTHLYSTLDCQEDAGWKWAKGTLDYCVRSNWGDSRYFLGDARTGALVEMADRDAMHVLSRWREMTDDSRQAVS